MKLKKVGFLLMALAVVSSVFVSCNNEGGEKIIEKFIEVENLELNENTIRLKMGHTFLLKATVTSGNAIGKTVSWTSTNPDAVSVDEDGTVTANVYGYETSTIIATAGGKSAFCEVVIPDAKAGTYTLVASGVTSILKFDDDGRTVSVTSVSDGTTRNDCVTTIKNSVLSVVDGDENLLYEMNVYPTGEINQNSINVVVNGVKTQATVTVTGNTDSSAVEGELTQEIFREQNPDYATITTYTVPDEYTLLGKNVFRECTELKTVILHEGITEIRESAFRELKNLTSVTIPNSVVKIEGSVFRDCSTLEQVIFGTESNLVSIGDSAFYGCKAIEYPISLGKKIESIGNYAFQYCEGIPSIKFNSKIKKIGGEAFRDCKKISKMTIPSSLETIGANVFRDCVLLSDITLEDGLKTIGNGMFQGCSIKNIVIPDSVTKIGNNAFQDCTSLVSITISNGIREVEKYAFQNCTSLETIEIESGVIEDGICRGAKKLKSARFGSGVTKVGNYIFQECVDLETVTIESGELGENLFKFSDSCKKLETINLGSGVTSLNEDKQYFYNSAALSAINVDAGNTVYSSEDGVLYNKAKTELICYPAAKTDESFTIPSSVERIADVAFQNNKELKSVVIGSNVEYIGRKAFYENSGLTSATFEDTDGWWCSSDKTAPYGSIINFNDNSLGDTATAIAANLLKNTHAYRYWHKTEQQPGDYEIESISFDKSTLKLQKDKEAAFSVEILPSYAKNKSLVWSSSNPNVATVDGSGKVTALKSGKAYIVATTTDGSNLSAICSVTVPDVVYSISDFSSVLEAEGIETNYDENKNRYGLKASEVPFEDGKLIIESPYLGGMLVDTNKQLFYNSTKLYVAVDTSAFGLSGNVTVNFNIKTGTSSNPDTTNTGIVFLSNSIGDIVTSTKPGEYTVPPKPLAIETDLLLTSGNTDRRTLSATVPAGEIVYLFYYRNGVGGGGLYIEGISVERPLD